MLSFLRSPYNFYLYIYRIVSNILRNIFFYPLLDLVFIYSYKYLRYIYIAYGWRVVITSNKILLLLGSLYHL